jgi:hypothetical protein
MHFVAGVDRGCVVSKAMVTPGSMSREVKPRRSALIAAIRQDRGEGQGNSRELRFLHRHCEDFEVIKYLVASTEATTFIPFPLIRSPADTVT